MKKKIIYGILALALISGGFWGYSRYQAGQVIEYSTEKVAKGTVLQDVFSTGSVIPAKDIDLAFSAQGKIEIIGVKVGDEVVEGQLLAALDDNDYQMQILEAQAALDIAQAKLAQVEVGTRVEDVSVSETALANAKTDLDQITITSAEDVLAADKSLASAQIAYDNAVKNLADVSQNAANDLQNDYDDSLDDLDGIYTNLFDGMDEIKDILEDDTFTGYCIYDSQLEVQILNAKDFADDALVVLKNELAFVKASSTDANIDSALIKFKTNIEVIKSALDLMYDGLAKSETSSSFTQTSLNTYKTNIGADVANANTAVSAINTDVQTIKNTKLSNTIAINTAQRSVDTAGASLTSAEQSLSSAQASANSKITSAENAILIAEKQLDLKKAEAQSYELDLAKAQVRQAEASLSKAYNSQGNTRLISPIAGRVAAVNKEVGENAGMGEAIVTLITDSEFQIESDVSESDIAKISLSDEVATTFDAFGPDKFWTGVVVKIDPAERVIQGVVYYRVTVAIENLNGVMSGMTANLTIMTDKKDNVLYIPTRAIKRNKENEYVNVLRDDNTLEERKVVSGLRGSEGDTEILEGLSEGEVVVISNGK